MYTMIVTHRDLETPDSNKQHSITIYCSMG